MWRIFLFFLILGLIGLVAKWIGLFIVVVVLLIITFNIITAIYNEFNSEPKAAYEARKEKEAEERRETEEKEKAEKKAEEAERRRKESEHRQHRDGDKQSKPYTYKIGKHGNESLAIRYGIANQERKVKEYWYYAKGGEKKRNRDRDRVYFEPAGVITVQKTGRVSKDLYEVLLTDYRNRKARAIIEVGTEYVKTFYPLDDEWFKKHSDLEETLKGNGTFTLKELATFHVQKAVGT